MHGTVWNFDKRSGYGLIEGSDGKYYHFSKLNYINSEEVPVEGVAVDFVAVGTAAEKIMLLMK